MHGPEEPAVHERTALCLNLLRMNLLHLSLLVNLLQVNLVTCCVGHLGEALVGATDQCTWEFAGFGGVLECGRKDEVSET